MMSVDGYVWSSVNDGELSSGGSGASCGSLFWDGTMVVGVGNGNGVTLLDAYSYDGVTWINGVGLSALINPSNIKQQVFGNRSPGLDPPMPGTPVSPVNQIANLEEWQNYDGTNLAWLDAAGHGFFPVKVVEKTTTYILTANDQAVVANSAVAFTLTLPVATGSGREYFIKNINTATITIDGDGADTIDGVATQFILQWEGVHLVDHAVNKWMIL
jgi:hypothetical protein